MDNFFEGLKNFKFDISEHNPTLRRWGTGFPHTEETKQLISELKTGLKQTPEHIAKRVNSMRGYKQSDYQKQRARESLECAWVVTDPNGKSMNIVNLRKFCVENKLDQGNMVKVSQGILKQHKGWTCFKVE